MKPTKKASEMTTRELAAYIDYSVLKPEFTEEQIIELTRDGVRLGCATICINPGYMELCEPYVKGSGTMLCPVCDFPFGASSTESKIQQIEQVAKYDTVKEVDIVANFGWARAGLYDKITEQLKACAAAAHKYGREIKVIFETDALNEEQIRRLCHCCVEAGADFVKSSTGFLTGFEAKGATFEVVKWTASVKSRAAAASVPASTSCSLLIWASTAWASATNPFPLSLICKPAL